MVLSASVKVRQGGGWLLMESDTDGMECRWSGKVGGLALGWLCCYCFQRRERYWEAPLPYSPSKVNQRAGQRAGFKVRV